MMALQLLLNFDDCPVSQVFVDNILMVVNTYPKATPGVLQVRLKVFHRSLRQLPGLQNTRSHAIAQRHIRQRYGMPVENRF